MGVHPVRVFLMFLRGLTPSGDFPGVFADFQPLSSLPSAHTANLRGPACIELTSRGGTGMRAPPHLDFVVFPTTPPFPAKGNHHISGLPREEAPA